MHTLYNLFIHIYIAVLHLAALFSPKVKTMLQGEKRCFEVLETISPTDKVLWFHCASLGEFEQGRPLIEAMRAAKPEYKILLSFYSPSGYEVRKTYSQADWVVYLPNDTMRAARRFVRLSHPEMTFFVKYEFWYNYLRALKGRRVFQVSLILRPTQYFFKPYGKWFLHQLGVFEHFFVQDNRTLELLKAHGYTNVSQSGDTRFDRVVQIASSAGRFEAIEAFCQGNKKIFLAGSSWQEDEKIIAEATKDANLKLILAPHEIDKSHIRFIQALFPDCVLYSETEGKDLAKARVLVVDCIGILSSLYRYCTIAYIGGGFGAGIHNTLEAAVFGKPICFGQNYTHFREAVDLIELSGGFCIKDAQDLKTLLCRLCEDGAFYRKSAQASFDYTHSNAGACQTILDYLNANSVL